MDYEQFLASKQARARPAGFAPRKMPPMLFGWQSDVAGWACRQGRAAIWAACGLGKTFMQLAWADAVRRNRRGRVLLLCPLAVGPQTVREAAKLGIGDVAVCSNQGDADGLSRSAIVVTNYQKVIKGHFDTADYVAVVLDESSILKSYTGTTKRFLCESFRDTPYKLCCTATPSPNDYLELGNHAEFLGVMGANEMIARWFINDGKQVGKYTLKGHAESDYWQWVASWATCLDSPTDLGYPGDNFVLPKLHVHQHVARVDATEGAPEGHLWRMQRLTATSLHDELRRTVNERADVVAGLVNPSTEGWIVWCNTDYEADALAARIPDAIEVRGSQPDHVKEARLEEFGSGRARVIITKPSLAGHGLNWQHTCHSAFVGLSHSWEQYHQAVRRQWRFGQEREVHAHVVTAETEGEVLATLARKEQQNQDMRRALVIACRKARERSDRERSLVKVEHRTATGDGWTLHLGDSCQVLKTLPDAHVGFTIFSPPFSNLYIYSDAESDMGNSADDGEFMRHYSYLVPELLRVTIPGRLCAVHCKDLPKYANRDDTAGLKDFPGELIRVMEAGGWSFHSRITVWKCPVTERERTNNNGLLHKTVCRDSSQIRQGMADYLLVFRRPPIGDGLLSASPIERPAGLDRWVGDPADDPRTSAAPHPSPFARTDQRTASVSGKPGNLDESVVLWRRYAEPVWWDVDQMDVLNHKDATGPNDERHICPLQLGLIRRAVHLWSNPGDVVLSPFAGIGSEGYVAVEERRRFVGCELKEGYWLRAQRHLANAASLAGQRGLFDAEGGAA